MLALAAANAVGAILFGGLYAVAGAELISQTAFVVCLIVLFSLATALWVRTEARHRRLDPLRRVSRATMGLVLAILAIPALSLMPLFWLDAQLPPEAGARLWLAGAMPVLLVALLLVVLVNVAGSLLAVVGALAGAPSRPSR